MADSGHVLLADFGACAILEREAAAPGLATALEDPSSHASSPPLGGAHRSQRLIPRRAGTPVISAASDDYCTSQSQYHVHPVHRSPGMVTSVAMSAG